MKVFLLYPDRDLVLKEEDLSTNKKELIRDLEINTLLNAMALGDEFLYEVSQQTLLDSEDDQQTILYRQAVLKDCLKNPTVIGEIYQLAIDAIEKRKKYFLGYFNRFPSSILYSSVEFLYMLVGILRELRSIADLHADKFQSEGFKRFFAMLQQELEEEYLNSIQNHLKELKFKDGALISAQLGPGNEGSYYTLCKPLKRKHWLKELLKKKDPVYSFQISPRDEAGCRMIGEIKDQGINLVANSLAQSADHIFSFITVLRKELAFYRGCLNLYHTLQEIKAPITFPEPVKFYERKQSFKGLYDICLALTMNKKVVGNHLNLDGRKHIVITGANQGGKSTFLRSIGLAQLMMQCGMFVAAESFSANICKGLFTHFKKGEDATMESGKFDEELKRMNEIANHLIPNSIILCNESFSATNEREGSEIAMQIMKALLEKDVKVFFVTHLYEFASYYYNQQKEGIIFLQAERKDNGKRTFRMKEEKPLPTGYGEDLYDKIFGNGYQIEEGV
jgi:DNA mismatch repair ATPase MutS